MYFHTYLGSGHFFRFKILNFNIFLGMKILWIFLWGHHKIGLRLVVIFMHFRAFFKVNVRNRGYFLGLPKFQIFLGVLEIPDIFWGEQ